MTSAILILQDGTIFEGTAFGAAVDAVGEVVFNTSMSGYQEILTDPSYAGQIVTLTQPHIGNYGISQADMESERVHAAALIVRELTEYPSNFRSEKSLSDWLVDQGVPGISGIDTRSLTRKIREGGVTKGILAFGAGRSEVSDRLAAMNLAPDYGSIDFVSKVSVSRPTEIRLQDVSNGQLVVEGRGDHDLHCVVVDFGVKHSILKHLYRSGFRVTRVPHDASIADIQGLAPDAIMLSNGPGDPAQMDGQLEKIRGLAERWPTWGICLGHQLISRAYGAQTFKLPYGHRGPNQPVQDLRTKKVAMTSQNHGYAVESESMPSCFEVTHLNLNDGTIEGIRHTELPVQAVQYHPEAGPGPHDAENFFAAFYQSVGKDS